MRRLIAEEAYEEAAQLRDEIKRHGRRIPKLTLYASPGNGH